MKKESFEKNIFVSSLIGFPIGIALLVMAYIGVFLIAGENVANNELTQLHNIKTLIFQAMSLGLAYYILFITFSGFIYMKNKVITYKFMTKHPYKYILSFLISILGFVLSIMLVCNKIYFTENVVIMNGIIMAILLVVILLILMLKDTKEILIIKKINIKIKEKNENDN